MSNQDGHQVEPTRVSLLRARHLNVVDLGLIRSLNERCLELLGELATSDRVPLPLAISANRDLWQVLDSSARARASHHPVLLMDINFADPTWWNCVADDRSGDGNYTAPGYLPPRIAAELMRGTATLAWTIARADEGLATVLCGMAPPVARIFSSFSPPDIEQLSARHHSQLRLRFDDHPSYWRMYLKIAGYK